MGADDDNLVRDDFARKGGDDVPRLVLGRGKGECLVGAGQAQLGKGVIEKRSRVLAGGGRGIARLEILKALDGLGQPGFGNLGDPLENPGIGNDGRGLVGAGRLNIFNPPPGDGPAKIEAFELESGRQDLARLSGY